MLTIEESRFIAATADLLVDPPVVRRSPSQLGQDRWALYELKRKRNGYFVEFGACDGLTLSNTLLLEREFGWNGIVAEPNPKWHKALLRNRHCAIDLQCVAAKSGETVPFVDAGELGGMKHAIALDGNTPGRAGAAEILVPTISLSDLLLKHKAPLEIDLLSIDTEGSEFEILTAFAEDGGFIDRDIGLLCIEHNRTEAERKIRDFMAGLGYEQRFPVLSKWDGWFRKKE